MVILKGAPTQQQDLIDKLVANNGEITDANVRRSSVNTDKAVATCRWCKDAGREIPNRLTRGEYDEYRANIMKRVETDPAAIRWLSFPVCGQCRVDRKAAKFTPRSMPKMPAVTQGEVVQEAPKLPNCPLCTYPMRVSVVSEVAVDFLGRPTTVCRSCEAKAIAQAGPRHVCPICTQPTTSLTWSRQYIDDNRRALKVCHKCESKARLRKAQ